MQHCKYHPMGCNVEAKDTTLHKNGIWQVETEVAQFVCISPPIEDIMCDISYLKPREILILLVVCCCNFQARVRV